MLVAPRRSTRLIAWLIGFSVAHMSAGTLAQNQRDGAGARLIVLIGADQFRDEYMTRVVPHFRGGLKRLLEEGLYFKNAQIGHGPGLTWPGFMALNTGLHPKHNGVPSHRIYETLPAEDPIGIFPGKLPVRTYAAMAGAGLAIGTAMNFYEINMQIASSFNSVSATQAGMTYDIGRVSLAIAYIGVFALLMHTGFFRLIAKGLAAVGRMALTNYVMHTVFGVVIFWGVGFGLFATLTRIENYYVVAAIATFQIVFSLIWFRSYRYGPLEWLLLRFSYQTPAKFKR